MADSRIQRDQERHQRSHKLRNTILIIIAVILIGGGSFAAYKYMMLKNAADKSYKSAGIEKERNTDALLRQKKPISILLMGTDTGELHRSYKGRTDTMMVVTINPKTEKTLITSIPRDTAVNIPGYPAQSPAKINAAYAYGSAKTSIETVQKMLNIPIDYYALINMRGLVQIVDQVGGVTISPLLTFDYEGYHFEHNQPTKMDGKKALAYSRMRYSDPLGDFGREQRQRQLLQTIVNKNGAVSSIMNQGFINSLSKTTQTDLTFGDLTKIVAKYHDARSEIQETYLKNQTGREINYQEMEVTPRSELQAATNKIRESLDLPYKETGSIAIH
ncbi:Cell envelope-associated transcriptional attenuator LytR-CpsA-Psr [Fructilactobacillus florum 8D]|uniref:Cell envelope-associated transcriptional attenuator LytR-CpsA-Psr n=1 Tax=Fructilactobacillus florum 8D TaxID=1221538 RepID=W9EFU4_9LACO|nr:LCP family protein [Fructilactobacillus florum]ETO41003.1 Cell envelope-associated transcriptional attenuator LytR-CpsA-Psr [Fructilactobacillus florum 8D]